MYLIFTDETNNNVDDSTFFLMGGIAVPFSAAATVTGKIDALRVVHGYRSEDQLKYARANKPGHITNDIFNQIKSDVLDLCRDYNIVIFLYACHHLIAEKIAPEKKFQWGSNGLLWRINAFLKANETSGWVMQDRHPVIGEFEYYKQRFRESRPEYKDCEYKLDRVLGFGSTCDGASNLASIADIALGSYRFCLNHPDKDIVNNKLMPKLLMSTWGFPNPIGKGISIYPVRDIKKRVCIPDYERLYSHIGSFLPSRD